MIEFKREGQDRGVPDVTPDTSWLSLLDAYCSRLAGRGSQQHADQHHRRVGYFMELLELRSFDDVTPRHAALWVSHLREHGQPHPFNRRPASERTIGTHVSCMNAMWKWLVQMEVVTPRPSPFAAERPSRPPKAKRRAFTIDEVGRLIHAAVRDESRCHEELFNETVAVRSTLYWAMACLGLRLSEAMRVRWRHLSMRSVPAEMIIVSSRGKQRTEETVTIGEDLAAALAPHHRDAADAVWPCIEDRCKVSSLRMLRRDCVRACVDEFDEHGRTAGWHSFRRFSSTEMLRAGIDIGTVQKLMRHASPTTTIEHYNDVKRENLDHAQRVLSERVTDRIPGRVTEKSEDKLERTPGRSEDDDVTSDHNDPINERGPPHFPTEVTIDGDAWARSLPPEADRVPGGGFRRASHTSNRFESCYAHLNTDPRQAAIDRLLTAASDLLRAAADVSRSTPGRGHEDVGRVEHTNSRIAGRDDG